MITAQGPKLIEYNVRFGDPECQVLMLRLMSDLLPALIAARDGQLKNFDLRWYDDAALVVVMATNGYPGNYGKGSVIEGLDAAAALTTSILSTRAPGGGRRSRRTAGAFSVGPPAIVAEAQPRLCGGGQGGLAGRILSAGYRVSGDWARKGWEIRYLANARLAVYIGCHSVYTERLMGILIKRPKTEDKIRELADRTGETITDAVDRAVDERLAKVGARKRAGRVDWARLETLVSKVRTTPRINEDLTDNEIVGYDEAGVPR